MASCSCDLAAEFPITTQKLGITSASLRSNTNIMLTEDGVALRGLTLGDLSITAYTGESTESLACSGRAGVSFEWDQRISCDGILKVYFIPRGKSKSFTEGDTSSNISLGNVIDTYTTFNASAGSGPATPYFSTLHNDGWGFSYKGSPLGISDVNGESSTGVSFLGCLPDNAELYLTSFNWEYTPPSMPTVSYSFIFVGNVV